MIRETWRRVQNIKNLAGVPAENLRSVGETYDQGEAWMRVVLDEAGIGNEPDIDAIAEIINENARVSLNAILSMDRVQLRQAAVIAGIAKPTDPPHAVEQVMIARLMHSAGFANGLALGLMIRGTS